MGEEQLVSLPPTARISLCKREQSPCRLPSHKRRCAGGQDRSVSVGEEQMLYLSLSLSLSLTERISLDTREPSLRVSTRQQSLGVSV